ncbi:MAG: DUF4262 domain-containing protein [Jatrophihabitans sp.]|uniref:DUF4262 domain-containing protein n=1 Tax=Jatrophihabitans sp. TaxID=1932789 RepID=UPI003F80BC7A
MTTYAAGSRPAKKFCRCRLCVPRLGNEVLDDWDQRVLDGVQRHGWYVIAVGTELGCACGDCTNGPDDGPSFAYTVGLPHRAGHPELAISGQSASLMHGVLNEVAERIVERGLVVQPGDLLEGHLVNAPLLAEQVSRTGLEGQGIGGLSRWFHRAPTPVLQLVWPSTHGVFGWQPGASPELERRQPRAWRIATTRTGATAVDPEWPLPVPPDDLAVVCTHVRRERATIGFVSRDVSDDGSECWYFDCGSGDHDDDELTAEHIAHTIRSAPSLRAIADLGIGQGAWRLDSTSPWQRFALP